MIICYNFIKEEFGGAIMRKKIIGVMGLVMVLGAISPLSAYANENACIEREWNTIEEEKFDILIDEIISIKNDNPGFTDEQLLTIINKQISESRMEKGIIDIWNSLTESEKKLCIRYPFDALKVNTARNIATEQTQTKFGYSGLGDRSDAFRHGIWNAEMSILIGSEKAELFATAHEDKDVSGNESDGFPKTAHKEMDLHNNEVGRQMGEEHREVSEDELADIIYSDIYSESTQFVWLHE